MGSRKNWSWARLKRFPPTARSSPSETRAILRFAVGRTFRVTSINAEGLVGLDLSPDADRKFGGFMHEIWVEPEYLERDVPRLNDARGRPALGDVIHLAHGDSTSGHLRLLGAKSVVGGRDSVTTGPSSARPAQHSALRASYWRGFYRRLAMRFDAGRGVASATSLSKVLARRRADQPVVLWSSGLWADLLFHWWACDALIRHRVPPKDVWFATARGRVRNSPDPAAAESPRRDR